MDDYQDNTRICKQCDKDLPINEFFVNKIIDGKEYRRHLCKKCHYKQTSVKAKEYATWLQNYKKKQHCCRCNNDDFRVLQFHHRPDVEKCFNIADASGRYSKDSLLKEIAKCDVLCANCHQIETHESRKN